MLCPSPFTPKAKIPKTVANSVSQVTVSGNSFQIVTRAWLIPMLYALSYDKF
jgi:hypothetical protein